MSETQVVRTRHPKSITRATILKRAYEMYLARELDHGDERLSVVLDSLGYTTGAGYQIWPNQAAFREDLKVYVAENIVYADLESVADKRAEQAARNLPFEQSVLHSGDTFFESFIGQEAFYLTLRFFAMGNDRPAAITEALSDAYYRASWDVCELFEASMAKFKRRMAQDFTIEDLTMSVTALLEGYGLRARVDPKRAAVKVNAYGGEHFLFSVGFLGVMSEFTEPDPQAQ